MRRNQSFSILNSIPLKSWRVPMLKKMNVLFLYREFRKKHSWRSNPRRMEETVSMLIVLAVNLQVRLIRWPELLQNLKWKGFEVEKLGRIFKEDSPEIDFVFTYVVLLQKNPSGLARNTLSAHWGIDDPAAKEGTACQNAGFPASIFSDVPKIDLFLNLLFIPWKACFEKGIGWHREIQWKSWIPGSISLFSL